MPRRGPAAGHWSRCQSPALGDENTALHAPPVVGWRGREGAKRRGSGGHGVIVTFGLSSGSRFPVGAPEPSTGPIRPPPHRGRGTGAQSMKGKSMDRRAAGRPGARLDRPGACQARLEYAAPHGGRAPAQPAQPIPPAVRARRPPGSTSPGADLAPRRPPPMRTGSGQNRSSLPGVTYPPTGRAGAGPTATGSDSGGPPPRPRRWCRDLTACGSGGRLGAGGASRPAEPPGPPHRPCGRPRPRGDREVTDGRSPAAQEFTNRLHRMAFTRRRRPTDRATRDWFLPAPARRRAPGLPSGPRSNVPLAGAPEAPRHTTGTSRRRPSAENPGRKVERMLHRRPALASLAPKSGQRPLGSRRHAVKGVRWAPSHHHVRFGH